MFNFSCPSVSIYGPILDSGSLNNISTVVLFTRAYAVWAGSRKVLCFLVITYVVRLSPLRLHMEALEFDYDASVGRNCRRNYIRIFVHERSRVSS